MLLGFFCNPYVFDSLTYILVLTNFLSSNRKKYDFLRQIINLMINARIPIFLFST